MVLLKKAREGKGLTQCQLAAASGVPQQTISAIESGKRKNPGAETLKKLATALETTMEKLYVADAEQEESP